MQACIPKSQQFGIKKIISLEFAMKILFLICNKLFVQFLPFDMIINSFGLFLNRIAFAIYLIFFGFLIVIVVLNFDSSFFLIKNAIFLSIRNDLIFYNVIFSTFRYIFFILRLQLFTIFLIYLRLCFKEEMEVIANISF